MCGIIGYVGNNTALPILVEGLRALEYRGYDSAGIFVPNSGVVKSVGPIANLEKKIGTKIFSGTTGIAHTRWATHGEPTEINVHPHFDSSNSIGIVHNGIIENFRELREGLIAQGINFTSDTDTEVLAKLIGSFYAGNLLEATQKALRLVRGTYGVVVSGERQPAELVVARLGSPIVLGIANHGMIVSSDPSALLPHTKDVVYLNDNECAVITKDNYKIYQGKKESVRAPEVITWNLESVQKQGYEHFMLKEIFEAPTVIEDTIRGRLLLDKGKVRLGGLDGVLDKLADLKHLTIVGCGSAYYSGLVAHYLFEEYVGLPTAVELGSEYRYKRLLVGEKSAVLAVSQSGETADTLASIRKAKEEGQLTIGVVNTIGSTIARETDVGVYNHAGSEIAVASTKAFISQLTVFSLLTLLLARERGMSIEDGRMVADGLVKLPDLIRGYLTDTAVVQRVAKRFSEVDNAMFIGRKWHMPIAYEGALKLKEVTYIHAEAYAGGELKHGSIALLDENFPVVAIVPQDEVYEKMISNIEEVKARKAPVIAIATEGDENIKDIVDEVIFVPKVHPILQPIVSAIPLQLLAYYIGVERGLNVDRPRNLAKSVTVE